MHVLLLTSERIFEMAYGGTERFIINLGKWVCKQNQEATLMGRGFFATITVQHLPRGCGKAAYEIINGRRRNKIEYLPHTIYFLSAFITVPSWIIQGLIINNKSQITLIHAQDTGYGGLAAVILGKLLKVPVILSSHGIRHKGLEYLIGKRLKKIIIRFEYTLDIFNIENANCLLVVNNSIKEYFEHIICKKVDVIPAPIKLDNFEFSKINRDAVRRELEIDDKTIIIGYVGRFSSEKNLLTLINAFADVTHINPSIKLVMVGAGPKEAQIKKTIFQRCIEDKVILCGVRYDIGKLLSSFDIFVLPSYTEGLAAALLEAMASGRALICSDIPAHKELLTHNEDAVLFNPYTKESLKDAILLLLSNDSLRFKLGQNAKRKVWSYDEEIIFPKILRYYEDVCIKFSK